MTIHSPDDPNPQPASALFPPLPPERPDPSGETSHDARMQSALSIHETRDPRTRARVKAHCGALRHVESTSSVVPRRLRNILCTPYMSANSH